MSPMEPRIQSGTSRKILIQIPWTYLRNSTKSLPDGQTAMSSRSASEEGRMPERGTERERTSRSVNTKLRHSEAQSAFIHDEAVQESVCCYEFFQTPQDSVCFMISLFICRSNSYVALETEANEGNAYFVIHSIGSPGSNVP